MKLSRLHTEVTPIIKTLNKKIKEVKSMKKNID